MSDGGALAGLVAAHHARNPPRTGSLIVTIFGVVALPAAAPIGLSALQEWLAALGIPSGLVRTALSRLVADGTLRRERAGKAAFYRLSGAAMDDFQRAADLIFGRGLPQPTGELQLALIEDGAARARRRTELGAAGFVPLAPNLMLRPEHAGVTFEFPGCLILRTPAGPVIAARAGSLWPLEALQQGYRTVAAHAGALRTESANMAPDQRFIARLLLVHEFRRILLRDPFLPATLLPPDWAGPATRLAFDQAIAALAIESFGEGSSHP